MKTVILVLSILLVLTGSTLFFMGNTNTFENVAAYDAYRREDGEAYTLPQLPQCAHDISLVFAESLAQSVSFTCADQAERQTFFSHIQQSFEWNVMLYEPDGVTLTRVEK